MLTNDHEGITDKPVVDVLPLHRLTAAYNLIPPTDDGRHKRNYVAVTLREELDSLLRTVRHIAGELNLDFPRLVESSGEPEE